jgi:phage terminase large subunit-like protein
MFDDKKADRAAKFIELLKHTKGRFHGQTFRLLPWQEQIIRDVYGTVNPDGTRQYRTVYIEIPKKNGKSELAAAVALKQLCADGEQRAEVYGCAADRQQASLVFDVAVDMVGQDPTLSKVVRPLLATKRLIYLPSNSFYQVLSAEAYTKHGVNASAVIFDELHVQPNRELWDVMTKGAGISRTQPLVFAITTAGFDRNSVCWELHQYALDVKEGRKIDTSFYGAVWSAGDDDDWADPEVWSRANPSLGQTFTLDALKIEFTKAMNSPVDENTFRQLHLNQWVKQSTRWMPMHQWDACEGDVDPDYLMGRECYCGLDLASSVDIAAFVMVFPPNAMELAQDENAPFRVIPRFWVPEEGMRNRVRKDHVPYDQWSAQGYLKATEGAVISYAEIERDIQELGDKYRISEIAFDRWGAVQMRQNLEGAGFTMVDFGQGYRDMSPPTKELLNLVLQRRIRHDGHPVLRWMADNVTVTRDPAENLKPDKAKSTERIDGIVATIMGLDRALKHEVRPSVYEERELLVL